MVRPIIRSKNPTSARQASQRKSRPACGSQGSTGYTGKFLICRNRKLREKEQNMFTIAADRLPAQGGIDPILKLIDRNPEDKCDEGREALAVVNGNSSVSERSRWQV